MCGIGGRTIAEAQQRISLPEFIRWSRYRRKRGSLNLGLRVERGSALLATLYANTHKGKDTAAFQLHDFAPHHDQPELTLEQAMATWG
ncbi:hypothetical protein SAMN05216198_1036 [Halopseudomonas litoralis]|uniref:Minor tail T domain-containing protein n=1 Tax=Halopseudomonas litoralis TaxID=797277 RepID=A0A1H1NXF5_9GAMM|nr:hypothetical protein [Halopseudomonas litoralis]SDS03624.1 hypothetical protein SAMN05216198_1036 [Halopseudomonas litoralis]